MPDQGQARHTLPQPPAGLRPSQVSMTPSNNTNAKPDVSLRKAVLFLLAAPFLLLMLPFIGMTAMVLTAIAKITGGKTDDPRIWKAAAMCRSIEKLCLLLEVHEAGAKEKSHPVGPATCPTVTTPRLSAEIESNEERSSNFSNMTGNKHLELLSILDKTVFPSAPNPPRASRKTRLDRWRAAMENCDDTPEAVVAAVSAIVNGTDGPRVSHAIRAWYAERA